MTQKVRRPHGHRQHGKGCYRQKVMKLGQAQLPAGILPPPVSRIHVGNARFSGELKGRAQGKGNAGGHDRAERNRQPAHLDMLQPGVHDDGRNQDDKGNMAALKALGPAEQLGNL